MLCSMLLILHWTVCLRTKTCEVKSFCLNLKSCKMPKICRNPNLACCWCKKFGHFWIRSEKYGNCKFEPWIMKIVNSKSFEFCQHFKYLSWLSGGLLIAYVTSVPSFDELSLLMHMNRNLYQWYITMFMLPYKAPTLKYPFTPKMSKQIF